MARTILRFHTQKVLRKQQKAWEQSTEELAREIEAAMKRSVAQPYPPASKPGRLPHRRTGNFQASIKVLGGKTLRVIASQVGKWLEKGTIKMRPRPWAERQFRDALGSKWARRFKEILKGKMRGGRIAGS